MSGIQNNMGSKHGRVTMNSLMERTDEENSDGGDFNRQVTAQEEEEEEDDDVVDEEKIKRYTKFNFSGLSFKDYVGNIKQRDLNKEILGLVDAFTQQKLKRHHGVNLSQRKMQLKHPIFRLISQNAFKFIVDRAYLFKLKKGQAAYREDKTAMKNVYFVLYGEFDYVSQMQQFGDRVGLGWTIGEEILFHKSDPAKRMETVRAVSQACLL